MSCCCGCCSSRFHAEKAGSAQKTKNDRDLAVFWIVFKLATLDQVTFADDRALSLDFADDPQR